MRLWSLHPRLLDRAALIAGWREALLAKAVLGGRTRGYRQHPQLLRFQQHGRPKRCINAYLNTLFLEAEARGYRFDHSKIGPVHAVEPIAVSDGQLAFEWRHLHKKVTQRSPDWLPQLGTIEAVACNPLFSIVPGPVADWERP